MPESYSGGIRPFYAVIIRDKCKTADTATLRAYKTVAEDLSKDYPGPEGNDLRAALNELNAKLK